MNRIASRALKTCLVVVGALTLIGSVGAQQQANSSEGEASRFAGIVELAGRELQQTRTPGAAIALVEGNRVVFSTGVGVADVETGSPVRPEMLFRLGSTTKMLTAAALVGLAEEGKVSLDAPIGAW